MYVAHPSSTLGRDKPGGCTHSLRVCHEAAASARHRHAGASPENAIDQVGKRSQTVARKQVSVANERGPQPRPAQCAWNGLAFFEPWWSHENRQLVAGGSAYRTKLACARSLAISNSSSNTRAGNDRKVTPKGLVGKAEGARGPCRRTGLAWHGPWSGRHATHGSLAGNAAGVGPMRCAPRMHFSRQLTSSCAHTHSWRAWQWKSREGGKKGSAHAGPLMEPAHD